jgi:hypothetical protein
LGCGSDIKESRETLGRETSSDLVTEAWNCEIEGITKFNLGHVGGNEGLGYCHFIIDRVAPLLPFTIIISLTCWHI